MIMKLQYSTLGIVQFPVDLGYDGPRGVVANESYGTMIIDFR